MADLNALFSKKKKKAGQKGGISASGTDSNDTVDSGKGLSRTGDAASKKDGWIEYEETKHAQVHTGGQHIVQLKRDESDNPDGAGDRENGGEKFSGWGKTSSNAEEAEEEIEKPAAPAVEFPSLADARSAPSKPAVQTRKSKLEPRSRPNFSALAQALGGVSTLSVDSKPDPPKPVEAVEAEAQAEAEDNEKSVWKPNRAGGSTPAAPTTGTGQAEAKTGTQPWRASGKSYGDSAAKPGEMPPASGAKATDQPEKAVWKPSWMKNT
ncbi:hypothetical protein NDN08_004399 [Rhodosorus marinus]|uniref:Uncharacterized protein n=1 Tax=Rhodosorus marinus TaxID=101924 RepID=A0AAV8UL58_9RHOD|nr:hypothetical protein NDN08_004399 [Rhodosorus marinus]